MPFYKSKVSWFGKKIFLKSIDCLGTRYPWITASTSTVLFRYGTTNQKDALLNKISEKKKHNERRKKRNVLHRSIHIHKSGPSRLTILLDAEQDIKRSFIEENFSKKLSFRGKRRQVPPWKTFVSKYFEPLSLGQRFQTSPSDSVIVENTVTNSN